VISRDTYSAGLNLKIPVTPLSTNASVTEWEGSSTYHSHNKGSLGTIRQNCFKALPKEAKQQVV
jgi:hypothetical protein